MATLKTITPIPPKPADPLAGLTAWNNLDHALRQLDTINDIAMELQPQIRELAPDGKWCADRLGFINVAVSDYVKSAREALDVLQAPACGKATGGESA